MDTARNRAEWFSGYRKKYRQKEKAIKNNERQS
jgi:hypothetical protein